MITSPMYRDSPTIPVSSPVLDVAAEPAINPCSPVRTSRIRTAAIVPVSSLLPNPEFYGSSHPFCLPTLAARGLR